MPEEKVEKRKIRIYGDPVLRLKAQQVEDFGEKWQPLIQEMLEICLTDNGAGLAAPQLGESIQLAVVMMRRENEEPFTIALFNPKTVSSEGESTFEEGCLSIPGIREEVVRPEKIKLNFQDYTGKSFEIEVDGLFARVLQHEIDHLNGVLFIDRVAPLKKTLLKGKLKRIAAGEPVE